MIAVYRWCMMYMSYMHFMIFILYRLVQKYSKEHGQVFYTYRSLEWKGVTLFMLYQILTYCVSICIRLMFKIFSLATYLSVIGWSMLCRSRYGLGAPLQPTYLQTYLKTQTNFKIFITDYFYSCFDLIKKLSQLVSKTSQTEFRKDDLCKLFHYRVICAFIKNKQLAFTHKFLRN